MLYSYFLNLKDSNKWHRLLRFLFVLAIIGLIYTPWLFLVLLSFFKESDKGNLIDNFSSDYIGFANYLAFFQKPEYYGEFWVGFTNSLLILLIVTPISLYIGITTSVSIWLSYGKHKKSIFAWSQVGIGAPDIIQGVAYFALFSLLMIPMGLFTVVVSHVAICIPFVIVFIYPKLSKINQNIMLASYDLQYTKMETIWKVLLPMLMPNIMGAILLIFSLSFDDFIITNMVRGNLTTITSLLYTMKKGVKSWVIVFSALSFWFVGFLVLVNSLKEIFKKKQKNKQF